MMTSRLNHLRSFLQDVRGTAAAEYVLCLPLLVGPVIAMVDLGVFTVQRMEVDAASQAGVAAAWHVCTDQTKPANQTNCTGGDLSAAITAAIQSTNIGTGVTLSSTPVVGYYCATDTGALTAVTATWTISAATPPAKPANCSGAVAGSTTAPAQYIQVSVSATYTPVFGALQAAGVLPATITRTSWRRLA
jgi:Flp pilus assembly protein TadG